MTGMGAQFLSHEVSIHSLAGVGRWHCVGSPTRVLHIGELKYSLEHSRELEWGICSHHSHHSRCSRALRSCASFS
ncbi:hypothetical protein RSAG8_12010, partial [Rhizoctonia solani AG-8 WAC10335]